MTPAQVLNFLNSFLVRMEKQEIPDGQRKKNQILLTFRDAFGENSCVGEYSVGGAVAKANARRAAQLSEKKKQENPEARVNYPEF